MKLLHLLFYLMVVASLSVAALEVVYMDYSDLNYNEANVYSFYPVDECSCECSNVYRGY